MYCTYTYSTHAHEDEGGGDLSTFEPLNSTTFYHLFDPNRLIINFRLKIFKVEGKRYIICSNREFYSCFLDPSFYTLILADEIWCTLSTTVLGCVEGYIAD